MHTVKTFLNMTQSTAKDVKDLMHLCRIFDVLDPYINLCYFDISFPFLSLSLLLLTTNYNLLNLCNLIYLDSIIFKKALFVLYIF